MEAQNSMENKNGITLLDLWGILRRSWALVLVVALLVGGLALVFSYLTYTPEYTAKSSMVVMRKESGSGNNGYSSSDYSVDLKLVYDVIELIGSHAVLDGVVEKANSDPLFADDPTSYGALKRSLRFENPEESRFVYIQLVESSPERAELLSLLLCQEAETVITAKLDAERVSTVDCGEEANKPSNPKFPLLIKLSPVIAAIVVYLFCVLFYLLDDRITAPEEVGRRLELNLLGVIPNVENSGKIKSRYYRSYYEREQYGYVADQANSKKEDK